MRCPECGARNADDAPWCTQCYTGLTPGDVAAPPAPPRDGRGEAAPEPPERAVRLRNEVVEWRCGACGSWTPLTAPGCAICASPRAGFGPTGPAAPQHPPAVALGPAMAASALLPGLGHLLRGQIGTGLGRLLLWVLWGGSAVTSLVAAGPAPSAVVLLLAALAVWVVSLVDLRRHASGQPPVADGRVLAWSVLGVTLALVVAVLAGTVGQGRA